MVRSMTGYGKSRKEAAGRIYELEIRSVNSKTLDLNCRLPAEYRELELGWRNAIAAVLLRGKAECVLSLTRKNGTAGNLFHLDTEQIALYRKEMQAMTGTEPAWEEVLHLPGAVKEDLPDPLDDTEREMLSALLQETLRQADQSRRQEGEVLEKDLRLRVRNIETFAKEVEAFETQRVPSIRKRIEEHLAMLNQTDVKLDANRLEQEMIYYLEKLDITEEKVRLDKHCRYFIETLNEEASGRKLAFIAQEMGREINTLGSKANDADMQKLVVKMKDELEKIKEQLFNIL